MLSRNKKSVEYEVTPEEHHVELPLYNIHYPHAFRWHGSVITRISLQVLGVTLWATLLTVLHNTSVAYLAIPTTVITLIGLVTSLLLIFRTNTAYDRFWEGRRIWAQAVHSIRHLARYFWVMTPTNRPEDLVEKRSAINLLHYLRAEYGSNYRDLYEYLNHIPKYNTPASVEPPRDPAHDKKHRRRASITAKQDLNRAIESNLPLEITIYIQSYIRLLRKRNAIEPPYATAMENALNSLVDCLTGFERILRTPIPIAYSVHLAQCIWLFCLALPFQMVGTLGWVTIPASAATAFIFMGIKSIGEEIENPFGYDPNDLPLDEFCRVVRREIEVITQVEPPTLEEWALHELDPSHIPEHVDYDTFQREVHASQRQRRRDRPTAEAVVTATADAPATENTNNGTAGDGAE
ncbi:Bestrophin, RFP-TM, chloride channel-domain-containing protein [Syncephalis plumigaleata]|nr:Bestrophin, RFP-TM, chloride channel-domain-containing protein [Syncephalis plumigaleata]